LYELDGDKEIAVQEYSALDLSDYLRLVDSIWLRWSADADGMSNIRFRGQVDAQWPLIPTLYRDPYSEVDEDRYRHEFSLRARPFLDVATTPPKDDWDWYFLMQHYDVPTRLLDWSESALAALYFAILPSARETTACIWVLQPDELNKLNPNLTDFVPIYSDAWVAPYLPQLWGDYSALPDLPIAIDPPHNSRRITAQRGKFVVFGRARHPMNGIAMLEPHLLRIDIPHEHKPQFRRQLLTAGIFESVLFPGLPGLGREIRELWSTEISTDSAD
jgi:hypothetical protein